MAKYIPVKMHPESMPVDISFVFKNEIPAGKHGFTHAEGDNLVFEDGTVAKFWGVMMNGAACFQEHAESDKIAQRLMQTGVNLVRLHQMDDEWVAPNLYRMTTGERVKNTRDLSDESFERLDYFIAALKKRGIYCMIDMMTYRRFKPGDGVKDAELLHDGTRLYAMYDERMIELQKEFMDKFWNHKNPYTGLVNKDDPCFAMCVIINENCTFIDHRPRRWYQLIDSYDQDFRDKFAAWLKEKGIEYDAQNCELFTPDEPMQQFRMELFKKYADQMYAHLREIGVKPAIICSNYCTSFGSVKAQENMDMMDAHCYFYEWLWGVDSKICGHNQLTRQTMAPLANQCFNRIHGKPMFLSEWDAPFPNAFRAEAALWFAAMCCLQNWTGMTAHTYGYGHKTSENDLLGKIATTDTIGGVPYREGIFAVWNDPAHWGLYYHLCLMVRRGDLKPANKVVGFKIDEHMYGRRDKVLTGSTLEIHQVHTVLDSCNEEGIDEFREPTEFYPREKTSEIISDTGEIKRFINRGIGVIDSPRTKSVYGKIGMPAVNKVGVQYKKNELTDLVVNCYTDYATVTMSSLTDEPINASDNILLTTIGRARNHGAQFDGDKMIDIGTNPIEVEVIHADIELKTSVPNLEVWAIDSEGFYSGRLNSVYEDGTLKFTVGEEFPCMYYLIVAP